MENSSWWNNSRYLGHFEPLANYVETLLPANLQSGGDSVVELPSDQTEPIESTVESDET
jgi:hypothetical protein